MNEFPFTDKMFLSCKMLKTCGTHARGQWREIPRRCEKCFFGHIGKYKIKSERGKIKVKNAEDYFKTYITENACVIFINIKIT